MKNIVSRLWSEEAGFVISTELVLVATILVLALVVGLATVRDAIIQELADVAGAIGAINQSYSWSGVTGHTSSVSGSIFIDQIDYCDPQEVAGSAPSCLNLLVTAASGG
jgi:hypothetical protein